MTPVVKAPRKRVCACAGLPYRRRWKVQFGSDFLSKRMLQETIVFLGRNGTPEISHPPHVAPNITKPSEKQ